MRLLNSFRLFGEDLCLHLQGPSTVVKVSDCFVLEGHIDTGTHTHTHTHTLSLSLSLVLVLQLRDPSHTSRKAGVINFVMPVCPFVRPSLCISSAVTGRIFVELSTGEFYENPTKMSRTYTKT